MATAGNNLSKLDAATLQSLPNGAPFRVGIAVSTWNQEITDALRNGAMEVLKAVGVLEENIIVREVPGAFELPLAAQLLLKCAPTCHGVIAIGSVIRGETADFDYVCQAASSGIMRVGIDQNKPAIFCVLTYDHIDQSRARAGGEHGNKGVEAAVACIQMLGLKANLHGGTEYWD